MIVMMVNHEPGNGNILKKTQLDKLKVRTHSSSVRTVRECKHQRN